MIAEYTEVTSSRRLRAAGPLDWKYVVTDLIARDAIPADERYEGMLVFVESDKLYILRGGIDNSDWDEILLPGEIAADEISFDDTNVTIAATEVQTAIEELDGKIESGVVYRGTFDPNNPPTPAPTDGDTANFSKGDLYIVSVSGFWNFTTGDQTPDTGGDNVADLFSGDFVIAGDSIVWEVVSSEATVTSVFDRTGAVEAEAGDYDAPKIDYDSTGDQIISTATDVEAAIKQLDLVVKSNQDSILPPKTGSGITVQVDGTVDLGGAVTQSVELLPDFTDNYAFSIGSPLLKFASIALHSLGTLTIQSDLAVAIISGAPRIESERLNLGGSTTGGSVRRIFADGSAANIDIELRPKNNGTVTVSGTTDYETFVTDDDDIPNKKYVDDEIAGIPDLEPGGSPTQVQFHDDGGVFGGDPNFTWDKVNNQLVLQGSTDNTNFPPLIVENNSGTSKFEVNNEGTITNHESWQLLNATEGLRHFYGITAQDDGFSALYRAAGTIAVKFTAGADQDSFIDNGIGLALGGTNNVAGAILTMNDDVTSILLPQGDDINRDTNIATPLPGMFRFNVADDSFEGYTTAGGWGAIAGGGAGIKVFNVVETSGDITLDGDDGNFFIISLTGDITSLSYVNLDDKEFSVVLAQDATGGHNVLSWGGILTPDGSTPDLTLDPNGISYISYINASGSTYAFSAGKLQAVA